MSDESEYKHEINDLFDYFWKEGYSIIESCKIMTIGTMLLFRANGNKKDYFDLLDSCKIQWKKDDLLEGNINPME